jgi:hypothetical protein
MFEIDQYEEDTQRDSKENNQGRHHQKQFV